MKKTLLIIGFCLPISGCALVGAQGPAQQARAVAGLKTLALAPLELTYEVLNPLMNPPGGYYSGGYTGVDQSEEIEGQLKEIQSRQSRIQSDLQQVEWQRRFDLQQQESQHDFERLQEGKVP